MIFLLYYYIVTILEGCLDQVALTSTIFLKYATTAVNALVHEFKQLYNPSSELDVYFGQYVLGFDEIVTF